MEEIIVALGKWEEIRKNSMELNRLFANKKGFTLDMNTYAVGVNLHAYPAFRNNELYFIVISEEFDVESERETLSTHCHWVKCVNELPDVPEMPEIASLENRVVDWQNNFQEWVNETATIDTGMYQVFNIPTNVLKSEQYSVYFSLKTDEETNDLKVADLVLRSDSDVYFDTVRRAPPYFDGITYYLLALN